MSTLNNNTNNTKNLKTNIKDLKNVNTNSANNINSSKYISQDSPTAAPAAEPSYFNDSLNHSNPSSIYSNIINNPTKTPTSTPVYSNTPKINSSSSSFVNTNNNNNTNSNINDNHRNLEKSYRESLQTLSILKTVLSNYVIAIQSELSNTKSLNILNDKLKKLLNDAQDAAFQAASVAKELLETTSQHLSDSLKNEINLNKLKIQELDPSSSLDSNILLKDIEDLSQSAQSKLSKIQQNYNENALPILKNTYNKVNNQFNESQNTLKELSKNIYDQTKTLANGVLDQTNLLANVANYDNFNDMNDSLANKQNLLESKNKEGDMLNKENDQNLIHSFMNSTVDHANSAASSINLAIIDAEKKLSEFVGWNHSENEKDNSLETNNIDDNDINKESTSNRSSITGFMMATAEAAAGTAAGMAAVASKTLKKMVSPDTYELHDPIEPAFDVNDNVNQDLNVQELKDKILNVEEEERQRRIDDSKGVIHDKDHARNEALAYVKGMREHLGEAAEYPALGVPRKELIREYEEVERKNQINNSSAISSGAHRLAEVYKNEAGGFFQKDLTNTNTTSTDSMMDRDIKKDHWDDYKTSDETNKAKISNKPTTAILSGAGMDTSKDDKTDSNFKYPSQRSDSLVKEDNLNGNQKATFDSKEDSDIKKENMPDTYLESREATFTGLSDEDYLRNKKDSNLPIKDKFDNNINSSSVRGPRDANDSKITPILGMNSNVESREATLTGRANDNFDNKQMPSSAGTPTTSTSPKTQNISSPIVGSGLPSETTEHISSSRGESMTNKENVSPTRSNERRPSKLHGYFEKAVGNIQTGIGKVTKNEEYIDKGWEKITVGDAEISQAKHRDGTS